ncbi:MAG: DUF86 domain-containing protein [Nanoarchaeota archaeon]
MKKDPRIFIKHIEDSIRLIENYARNVSEADFFRDKKIQDAIVRRLEIIGEAAKNIPSSLRQRFQEVPWKEMMGIRDKIAHHYFGIDLKIVWNVIKKDLPKLKKEIRKILDKEK